MLNLRISMIVYGLINMAEGIVMWLYGVDPASIAGYLGFPDLNLTISGDFANFVAYILAVAGAAFIAAGFSFIWGAISPVKNLTVVRLIILWTGLTLAAMIYALIKGFVTFGNTWFSIILSAIFLVAFVFFYPWPWRKERIEYNLRQR
jgi:hypothetical protein